MVWILNHYGGLPGEVRSDRTWQIAQALASRGMRPVLFYASQHHGLNIPTPAERVGRVQEMPEGYCCLAVQTRSYEGNGLARLLNMLDYRKGVLDALSDGTVPAPDLVIASSPHPFAVTAALALRRRCGAPLVFEERDLWPLSLVELAGASPWHPAVWLFERLVRRGYRGCDALVSLLPGSEPYLRGRGLSEGKFHYIPNGVDAKHLDADPEGSLPEALETAFRKAREEGEFVVVYTGAMGPPNALDQWFDLAPLLCGRSSGGEAVGDEGSGGEVPLRVILIGDGVERGRLEERSHEPGCDFVSVFPPVAKAAALEAVRRADAAFIALQPAPLFRFGVSPNKLFDYLGAGKPVLFAVNSGNNPVAEAGAGLTVPPRDAPALLRAVRELWSLTAEERQALGDRGRTYVRQHHSWDVLGERYATLVHELLKARGAGRDA